jgi:S-adenosylhomocysteine hydrolase
MSGQTDVDLSALDALSSRLRVAADALDAAGGGAPGMPNAGDVSGIMGAAIAHLTHSAGNLVLGMKAAGAEVAQARSQYAGRDQAAAARMRGH